jgi:hypothetical protein
VTNVARVEIRRLRLSEVWLRPRTPSRQLTLMGLIAQRPSARITLSLEVVEDA